MTRTIRFEKEPWRGSDKDWVKPVSYQIFIDDQPAGWLCEHYDGRRRGMKIKINISE